MGLAKNNEQQHFLRINIYWDWEKMIGEGGIPVVILGISKHIDYKLDFVPQF